MHEWTRSDKKVESSNWWLIVIVSLKQRNDKLSFVVWSKYDDESKSIFAPRKNVYIETIDLMLFCV